MQENKPGVNYTLLKKTFIRYVQGEKIRKTNILIVSENKKTNRKLNITIKAIDQLQI